eukprot:6175079-Pleurochrysis_carterae.AAC.1
MGTVNKSTSNIEQRKMEHKYTYVFERAKVLVIILQYCNLLSHSSLGEWRRDGPTYALSNLISVAFYLTESLERCHYKHSLDDNLQCITFTWSFRGNRHHVKRSCRSDASDRVAGKIPYIPPSVYTTAVNVCR